MNISIVIPIYNSSQILNKLIIEIKNNLKRSKKKFEVILVNDASLDQSWQVIKKLQKKFKFIKSINLKKNIGQHGAIFVGLKYSKGKKIIIMDDDLQHPPKSILDIIKILDASDACYTKYLKRKHILWKIIISKINHYFSNLLFYKPYNIYLSSFKGINFRVKNLIIKEKPKVIFLDSLILKHSKKINYIYVQHKSRFEGLSNYNLTKLFKLWFDMIENYHFFPIRFGTLIGLVSYIFVKILRFGIFPSKFKFQILEKNF